MLSTLQINVHIYVLNINRYPAIVFLVYPSNCFTYTSLLNWNKQRYTFEKKCIWLCWNETIANL